MKISVSLRPHQTLLLSNFLIIILLGVKYLTGVLICILWGLMILSIFPYVYWPFVYLLWRNVYSHSMPMFDLGYLSVYYWVVEFLKILLALYSLTEKSYIFIISSFIKLWLTNKNCSYLDCTFFFKVYKVLT